LEELLNSTVIQRTGLSTRKNSRKDDSMRLDTLQRLGTILERIDDHLVPMMLDHLMPSLYDNSAISVWNVLAERRIDKDVVHRAVD
jgi:hypothetical protein